MHTITLIELDAIEALLALPAGSALSYKDRVQCATPHTEIDLISEELRSQGFVSYASLADFRVRRPFERSLWLRRDDDRCTPELYVLATMKYGRLPPVSGVQPYWTDKNYINNNIENVSIALPRTKATTIVSKYGVRAGTPEYWKAYYADPDNKAKQRKAARDHAARSRQQIRDAKQALKSIEGNADPLQELRDRILGLDGRVGDDDDRAFGRGEDGTKD